ncbi:uncharacterized protein [Panulirus ornatus]|uniref:uncharacterized protein n=1 Tax=Panulirus ornatus TaxID=150431 RepID=UPI003A8915D0
MDENQTKPFFSQFRSLCKHVNEQIRDLKEQLNKPAGQNPQNYDRGLGILKKESQDLKKQSQEVREKLAEVTNFSSYLESVQELVNQQSNGIDKMEQYLKRYDYVPPQPKITAEKVDDDKENVAENKEETSDRCSEETTTAITLYKSPVLSEVGQQVLQGKELPMLTPSKQMNISAYNNLKTPVTSNTHPLQSSDITASSVSTSSLPWSNVTVDEWLTEAKETIKLTPDVLRVCKLPVKEKVQYKSALDMGEFKQPADNQKNQSHLIPFTGPSPDDQPFEEPSDSPVNNASNLPLNGPGSPSEPEYSEYTMQLLALTVPKQESGMNVNSIDLMDTCPKKNIKSATPEEPSLLSFSSSNSRKIIMSGKDCTPEEPVLSYQHHLSFSTTSNVDNETPEEPVLSYQHGNSTSHHTDKRTPEEPTLSTAYEGPVDNLSAFLQTPHRSHSEVPLSPELSEVTRSLLSVSSLSLNPQSYQPRRNLYITRNMHEQLENKHSFSPSHGNKNSNHISLGRNISVNSLGSRYISQQSRKCE